MMDSATDAPVSGIYHIRNRHTGRVYIGKSSDIRGRWLAHRTALERRLHINDDLQGDWEVYGADAFEFTILEMVRGHQALCLAETRHLAMAKNPYNIVRPQVPNAASAGYPVDTAPITPPQFLELLYDGIEPPDAMRSALYALCDGAEAVLSASLGAMLSNALEVNPDVLRDFAVFQDWGYRGLYAGETARDIHARKGLARGQHILDWMGPDELAANLFRASLTEQRLRHEPGKTRDEANRTHRDVGAAVRKTIIEQGGTPPEHLPTPEVSIQELHRREQKRIEAERQPPLFPVAKAEDAAEDQGE